MASLILSTAGSSLFGTVGGFVGALAGRAIDSAAVNALTPARVQPSRLAGLKVQASQEGAPVPIVYGRFRVSGQVIWASRFNEITTKRTVGGKGGRRVIERSYTISFAIGLAEGPIDGLGRVWVNGDLLDLSTLSHRLYLGSESQMPDPLIEALEGLDDAPAFAGLAYVVFEDFAVSAYGDRIPQFSFEIMASPRASVADGSSLRDLAQGVCLIPGAGEFAYATTPFRRILAPGNEIGENLHASSQRSDFEVSLDNLARDLPNVKGVSFVVAWFGTDLRAGQCQIVPKVEGPTKQTSPRAWSVAGLTRATAQIVSQSEGKPAYGGSPDDQSVIEAIIALKARGYKVTHNPFVMMDIASGNNLPNPLGGATQAPYPWRGRITCFPGIGRPGSVDASAAAATQIAAFFGTATASQFSIVGGAVTYSGPQEWSYRRFILHQAALCAAAGGVDAFLIGSELIGLTRVRASATSFPAVTALIALAGEVRTLLGPGVKISYGADWTEYGGYQPPGTNDLRFPLDPLWANANVDFIGLDWYAPLTDRRDGDPRADLAALKAGIESGEGFDFFYANDADRLARAQTPITDSTYLEPWVWRQKDVRGFWSNAHYERNAGVRSATPTAWTAKSKPLALLELGFPAVDKGANRPSVFPDPKSVEAGLPPFSNGVRDDQEQRLALEATLSYWRDNNPASNVYAGNMFDMSRCFIWAWDARPYPHFPALTEVWADGAYAMLGHWLAGRTGPLSLAGVVRDIALRGGLERVEVDGVSSYIDGFAIETPTSARSILENIFTAFGLEAQSRTEGLVVKDAPPPLANVTLSAADIIVSDGSLSVSRAADAFSGASTGRFSCYAAERDYLPATFTTIPASDQDGASRPVTALASSVVLDPPARQVVADRLARSASRDGLSVSVAPAIAARLEAGDRIALSDGAVWRAERTDGQLGVAITASRATDSLTQTTTYLPPQRPKVLELFSPPVIAVLDLTAPFTLPTAPQPLVGCASATWPGDIDIMVEGKVLGTLTKAMTMGTLAGPVGPGPVGRLMRSPLTIAMTFGAVVPATGEAALVQNGDVADIISWRKATLVGQGLWQIEGWVRGLNGLSAGSALAADTTFLVLNDALVEMPIDPSLVGVSLNWEARPTADVSLTTTQSARFRARATIPWPPCAARAKRTAAGIVLSWTRRARGNGDAWAAANVPLGAVTERYVLDIKTVANAVVRRVSLSAPTYTYTNAQELADFGSVQAQLVLTIRQIGDDDREGEPLTRTITV